MENKYYTPTIEEFHVGFEYYFCSAYQEGVSATEIVIDEIDGYEPQIFNFDVWNYQRLKGESWKDVFTSMIENNQVKVKYLDKEDIESLTILPVFKIQQSPNDPTHVRIWSEKGNAGYSDTIFEGTIKNKSELKVLLKQLNING